MAKPAQRRKSPSARTPHEPCPRTPRFGKLEVCHSQSPPSAPLSRAPLGGSGLGDRSGLGGISGGGSVHGDTGRSGGAPSGHRSILPPPAVRRTSSGSSAPPANERARRTSFTAAAAHNFDAAAAQAAAASAEAQEAAAAEAAAAEAAANAETQLPACDVEMGAAEESPEEQTQPDARAGLNAAAEAAEAAAAEAAQAAEAAANAEAETQLAPPEEEAPRGLRPAPAVARPPQQRSRASELRRSETVAGVEDFMRSLTPDASELRCTKAVGPTGGPSQLRPGCAVALRTTLCPIPSPSPNPNS